MPAKLRVDLALVANGLADSRSEAQSLIKAGYVLLDMEPVQKASQVVAINAPLFVKAKEHPWVSRGGMKLAHALDVFDVSLKDKVILDLGASTGGFSDVALQKGAAKVFAVDVGQGQLSKRVEADPRVVSLEKTNARVLNTEIIPDPIDILVCDVSFISLKLALPAGLTLVKEGGEAIVLIKPQFEVGKGRVGKGGIVKDPALHEEVCLSIHQWFDALEGWCVKDITTSPITGPDGNVEFLLYAKRSV